MEITTAAGLAVTLLAPYLTKAADKAAETLGEKAVEAVGTLYCFLKQKFSREPGAAEALNDLEEEPSDADRQAALRRQIAKVAEQDPDFASNLQLLLEK